ncbi:hypothetical protein AB0I28_04860 [Phytomonospora sp. NPDC050363]|uniref:hypothetical protein n=1 Tax=Phytomonospora sp. NPDC050363 TaxID=3155642 RepID=UPI0033F666F3
MDWNTALRTHTAPDDDHGDFVEIGILNSRGGTVVMSGVDSMEYIYREMAEGPCRVFLAYRPAKGADRTWVPGFERVVAAVALIPEAWTPEQVAASEVHDGAFDSNYLDPLSAVYSDLPDVRVPAPILLGEKKTDPEGYARKHDEFIAELQRQDAAGVPAPMIEFMGEPAGGANGFLFPAGGQDSLATALGGEWVAEGNVDFVIWSGFEYTY